MQLDVALEKLEPLSVFIFISVMRILQMFKKINRFIRLKKIELQLYPENWTRSLILGKHTEYIK